ncbi:hypothetical protein BC941DRAFT_424078, partial [Chlamydoabsidia padenii]
MSVDNNNTGYNRRYRPNSTNRNSPQPQRDMERSWRRVDPPPKSEMSSSAWHSPQQFILEQDQRRRAEYLAEKEANPSSNDGPIKTKLTIVENPERLTSEITPSNGANIGTATISSLTNHNKDIKYYVDRKPNKAIISLEDIDVASDSPPESPTDPTKDSKQTNTGTEQDQQTSDTSNAVGSWRSLNNEHGSRNRSKKPDHGNSRNNQQQWSHKHPDDKHSKYQPVLYDYFMDHNKVMNGLEHGDLYKCTLRINRRKRMDAYATSEALDGDIYLFGDRARNRALDGDVVAVRLLDVDYIWQKRTDRDKRYREKVQQRLKHHDELPIDDGESNATVPVATVNEGELDATVPVTTVDDGEPDAVIPLATLADDDTANNNTVDQDDDDDDDNTERKPQYAGEVVYILDRAENMTYTGTISTNRPGQFAKTLPEGKSPPEIKYIWFKPTDKRTPLMMIDVRQAPDDVVSNAEFYATQLVEVSLLRWPISYRSPFGKIVRILGPIGDLSVAEKAVLADNNVLDVPFDNLVMKHLDEIPRSISASEIEKRRDLRNEQIFTIDPQTAKDLDDALHIKRLDDGTFEVGVHIADVSYYVKQDTLLDGEARKRGTTTYLVNRSIPMLPNVLCEDLCSLSPNVDKLAFSVIWVLDQDGNIQKSWFGRTVIRSCSKLAYEDAQSVIDNGHLPEHTTITTFSKKDVEQSIMDLYKLSVVLRKTRYDNGALSMNSVKLTFTLDDDDKPIGVSVFESKEANKLIEEFMLLANISVAEKIFDTYPSTALLRRHELPIERRLNQFLDITRDLGYDFDVGSAAGLQASFNALDDEEVKNILLVLAIQPMKRATYICSGAVRSSKYLHYALNQDYYTHFTSPIRRYADVIVHRLLDAAIHGKDNCGYDKKTIQTIALRCNRKKDGAKNAQEADIMLYLAHYLSNLERTQGTQTEKAVVIGVRKQGYDIYVPKYGLEYRVQTGALPLDHYKFDSQRLDLFWKAGVQVNADYFDKARNRKWDDDDDDDHREDGDQVDELATKLSHLDFPRKLHPATLDNEKCKQSIDLLTTIDVNIIPDDSQTPPRIHIFPVNPF